jgi:hypothetical protein
VKLAPVATVLLVACAGAAPHEKPPTTPDRDVELRLRADAATYLGCSVALTQIERVAWAGDRGRYRARGCGFEIQYVVGCDAPDRCGFSPAP